MQSHRPNPQEMDAKMEWKKEVKEKQQVWVTDEQVTEEDDGDDDLDESQKHQPPNISPMFPCQKEAYGGGFYGKDDDDARLTTKKKDKGRKPAASETQSADGPVEATITQPKHKPPPSSGDRDIDITGQSYIQ
ncbi:OLC1v1018402C1 [Oldenlandia corymbosa var. corymbosa]|uniref:OLC1v1018402C1 n=1 Tax=Oldenlandia corymbosa var. corymbosa TaxID=529605 RepID=A0AAV1EBH7_OLDCO|nr:OLC1v1018402C1 [Oldenlandia corymbosa var. corymbosa]